MTRWPVLARLRRDTAGCVSFAVLALVCLACVFANVLSPHPYDAVYPDYVTAPATLSTHPTRQELVAALGRLAVRSHVDVTLVVDGAGRALRWSDTKPVDPRVVRTLERSDMFRINGAPRVENEGRTLTVPIEIVAQRFIFGTDTNGRDLLARILIAGRISLAVGALASAVALGIGVAYGALAGYAGGRTDQWMMRLVDVVYALPFIFLVIVLLALFGRNLWLIFLAIGAVEWLDMARIVRGQTLSLRRREFVVAAQALGETDTRVLARHIVPNISGPIVAYLALLVPRVILAESFLSFLGLGVQEPLTSWGILIADGARQAQGAIHLLVFPALALAITVIASNQFGEACLRVAGPAGE